MRLIIIRHAEPDYKNNTITEKGKREAQILAKRLQNWKIDDFYTSPLNRAVETSKPTLEYFHKEAEVLPWAQEFNYVCVDPYTGKNPLCWDYVPSDWTSRPESFTFDEWVNAGPMKSNPDIASKYKEVCDGVDDLLLRYGYKRDGLIYRTVGRKQPNMVHTVGVDGSPDSLALKPVEDDKCIVIFCHLGVGCMIMSRLLNIPFQVMPHAFFLPPSSVNILTTEERWEDEASFRAQAIGDVSHLLQAGEPVSSAGAFSKAFQK